MWSSPQKIFSPWRSPLKSGSLDSRPVPLASIEVDNHEKKWNKYVIVLKKWVFLRDARLSKVGLDSRTDSQKWAPLPLASKKLIITKKCYKSCDRPLKKFFSVTRLSSLLR